MEALPFLKMHGLGNDFVVVDARARMPKLDIGRVRAIADRHKGVGFDQLVIIEKPTDPAAAVFFRFLNSDGSEAGACGNGTRCVADHVMRETGTDRLRIQTRAGILESRRASGGQVAVDMGPARLDWREIPLARECNTLHVPLTLGPLADPVATGMGNPHATFFVADVTAIELAALGPQLENHPMFPERANIGIAQIVDPETIRLRVWERGAGITLACGSGACAATVAAVRRNLVGGRRARVIVDGSADGAGALDIEWHADGHVLMAGPVALAFSGVWQG
ncbi:MAG: diaminopimelate epimerase [Alphaproteobacteria bacterium]|nr:diaminopimelate epimerase [Alphaproteobacteria bacterium]